MNFKYKKIKKYKRQNKFMFASLKLEKNMKVLSGHHHENQCMKTNSKNIKSFTHPIFE